MKEVFMNLKGTLCLAVFFSSTLASATTVKDFVGSYRLSQSNPTNAATSLFCYEALEVQVAGKVASVFLPEQASYGPLYQAEVNGRARKTSGSHGEGMESSKGQDEVSFANGILGFKYTGTVSLFGIPSQREANGLTMKLSSSGKELLVTRSSFEGIGLGIGKKDSIQCVYQK